VRSGLSLVVAGPVRTLLTDCLRVTVVYRLVWFLFECVFALFSLLRAPLHCTAPVDSFGSILLCLWFDPSLDLAVSWNSRKPGCHNSLTSASGHQRLFLSGCLTRGRESFSFGDSD